MVSIQNPCFYWLDKDTFILAFDGGIDDDGDEYFYQIQYQKDNGHFIFERWYEFDITPAGFTVEQENYIKSIIYKKIGII